MTIRNRIVALAVLLAGVAVSSAADAEPIIVTQKPCVAFPGEADYCTIANEPVKTVRSITFSAPSAGTAVVSFHGSVDCDTSGLAVYDREAILETQIVTNQNQTPDGDGPGGLFLRTVLKNTPEHTGGQFDSFNLASTRVVEIGAAGKRRFYFRMARLDEPGLAVACKVYNAAFTVLFVPS